MGRTGNEPSDPSPLKRRSPALVRLFGWYATRFVARHFRAVRLSRVGARPALPPGPVVVAMSHPSWWDPLLAIVLAPRTGDRIHVAPIEARALERYRFFSRLGFFGIEPGTSAGWRRFLEVGDEVLARADGAFWVTPQGRFADPRERPRLRSGIGHLAHRMRGGTILPVALEYPFWSERLPEALARFGEPVPVREGRLRSPDAWTERISDALDATVDALADDSVSRDPDRFETLLGGRSGVGWAYDLWRRARSLAGGAPYSPDHASVLTRGSRGTEVRP